MIRLFIIAWLSLGLAGCAYQATQPTQYTAADTLPDDYDCWDAQPDYFHGDPTLLRAQSHINRALGRAYGRGYNRERDAYDDWRFAAWKARQKCQRLKAKAKDN